MKTTKDYEGSVVPACCEDAESIVWQRDAFSTGEPSWRIPLDRRSTDDPMWSEVKFCPWCGTKLTPPDVEA